MMLPLLVSRPPSSMLSEAPEPPMPKSSCPVPVFHSASCPLIVTSPDAPDVACPTVPPLLFTLPPFRTFSVPLPVTPTITEADPAFHSASFR